MVATAVAVILMVLYLYVTKDRNQVATGLILFTIADLAFSAYMPAFLCGVIALALSISTNLSTLMQLKHVIAERSARYINFPLVVASLANNSLWFVYASLKGDIPVFVQTASGLMIMAINLVFFLWAEETIPTSKMQTLINVTTAVLGDQHPSTEMSSGSYQPRLSTGSSKNKKPSKEQENGERTSYQGSKSDEDFFSIELDDENNDLSQRKL